MISIYLPIYKEYISFLYNTEKSHVVDILNPLWLNMKDITSQFTKILKKGENVMRKLSTLYIKAYIFEIY